jgi:hypothetical protein
VPTDVLLSIRERRAAERRTAANLRAILLLIPLIACLISITLSVESRAFEFAIIELGAE